MHQTGDNVALSLKPVPTNGTAVSAYVWEFWDGTTETTIYPWVNKRVNMGGHPAYGTLAFSVTAVGFAGESVVTVGTLSANNPPTIVSPTIISANNRYFPFTSHVTVRAFDFDSDPVYFGWYSNDVFLSSGTNTTVGPIGGTWAGNGTVLCATRTAYDSMYEAKDIVSDTPLTVYVRDDRGGTSALEFNLYGKQKPVTVAGLSGGSSSDNNSIFRIGDQSYGTFSAYAKDPTGLPVYFQWQFAGSNGWDTGPVNAPGVTTRMPDGGYSNSYTKYLAAETIPSGSAQKVAQANVFIWTDDGNPASIFPMTVTLTKNTAPSGVSFIAKVGTENYDLVKLDPIPADSIVVFTAKATDVNKDLVQFKWTFTQPTGVLPTTLVLWGPKVSISAAGYSGYKIQATVVATDQYGGTATATTPAIPVT